MDTTIEIKQIVSEILETEQDLAPTAHLTRELGMDSILLVDIVTKVEKKFSIKVPEDRVRDFQTVAAIVSIVEQLRGK